MCIVENDEKKTETLLSASCLSFRKGMRQIKKWWPWFIFIMVLSLSEYRLEFWCYLYISFRGNALLSSVWQRKLFKNGTRRLKRRIPVMTLNTLIVSRGSGDFWCLIESRGSNTDHGNIVSTDVTSASELWSCLLKYWVWLKGWYKNQKSWLTIAATKLVVCHGMWKGLMHILGHYSQLCELTSGCMEMWESALPSGAGGEAAASVTDTNLNTAQSDTGSPQFGWHCQFSAGGLHVQLLGPATCLSALSWALDFFKAVFVLSFSLSAFHFEKNGSWSLAYCLLKLPVVSNFLP